MTQLAVSMPAGLSWEAGLKGGEGKLLERGRVSLLWCFPPTLPHGALQILVQDFHHLLVATCPFHSKAEGPHLFSGCLPGPC